LKENPDIDNPWAVAWWLYQRKGSTGAAKLTAAQLDESVQEFHRERQAGTLLAHYEQAAAGNVNAQAVLMSPSAFRFA